MNVLANLARVTTATTGTGTLTLGSAVPGFLTFAQAGLANGAVVTYAIEDAAGGHEIGRGTYTLTGTTLSRDLVYRSTGAGNTAAISLSGSAQVYITPAAEDLPASLPLTGGTLSGPGNLTMSGALNVGSTAAPGAARTYNAYTDASNYDAAYMGDWAASVARYGTVNTGTFTTARNVQFLRGGTEFFMATAAGLEFTAPYLGFSADGSLGPSASVLFRVGGAFTIGGGIGLTTNGVIQLGSSLVISDTVSTTTVANASVITIPAPTVNTSNVVNFTRASTLRIGGPPTAGGSATITNPYAVEVTTGESLFTGGIASGSTTLMRTTAALTNAAGAATATLTNAPVAGNPTKWINVNDNGTVRRIPAW